MIRKHRDDAVEIVEYCTNDFIDPLNRFHFLLNAAQMAGFVRGLDMEVEEVEVLDRIARGKRVKEVATELDLCVTTVQTYLRRIYEKLQVHSQAEAVAKFLR